MIEINKKILLWIGLILTALLLIMLYIEYGVRNYNNIHNKNKIIVEHKMKKNGRWFFNKDGHDFDLTLWKSGNKIIGNYCYIYNNNFNCPFSETDEGEIDEKKINIKQTSANIFTVFDNRDDNAAKVQILFLNNNNLSWKFLEITQGGLFRIPQNIELVKFRKNPKQEKIVENKTTKIEKENKENKENKQKVLLKNIEFGNKKVDVIEDKNEKDENNVDITKLIIRDKETEKETLLDKFKPFEIIPINIYDIFTFKGNKDNNYIIVITREKKEIDSSDYYMDIFIYNSKLKRVFGLEGSLYEISFDDKEETLNKLRELEKEGKL